MEKFRKLAVTEEKWTDVHRTVPSVPLNQSYVTSLEKHTGTAETCLPVKVTSLDHIRPHSDTSITDNSAHSCAVQSGVCFKGPFIFLYISCASIVYVSAYNMYIFVRRYLQCLFCFKKCCLSRWAWHHFASALLSHAVSVQAPPGL